MKYFPKQESLNLAGVIEFIILASVVLCEPTSAQIQSDGTLGAERSTILPHGNAGNSSPGDLITGGARRESNLFHSFKEFNVGNGQSIYFNNPDGVTRIFSRVTGGNPSNIMGKLGVWNGNADLFLINPNGILFGRNASLHLGGSFIASTASSIIFAGGIEFSATNPSNPPLLTIDLPIGLRFDTKVGAIRNQSTRLEVTLNRTLALVGGELILDEDSFITTGSGIGVGRIDLGGVGAGEQVSLRPVEQGWALGYETVHSFADVFLQRDSDVGIDSSGEDFLGSGEIQVYGRNILFNAAQIFAYSGNNPQPAKIEIYASESIELGGRTRGQGTFSDFGSSIAASSLLGSGAERAGDITIVAKNLRLTDAATITTGTFTTVPGGNITIVVTDSIELTDDGSNIFASTSGEGRAGDIRLTAKELHISSGAYIAAASNGRGDGGNLVINASSIRLSNYAVLSAETTAGQGNITLRADDIILRNNSQITTNATGKAGGGNITINTGVLAGLENSDITANAFFGEGGKIEISAEGIFGLISRSREEIQRLLGTDDPNKLDPRLLPSSDITAISQTKPFLSGLVTITTPEIDPSRGLIELPEIIVDPTTLIAQNPCRQGTESELTVTGRGGLPPGIQEDLSDDAIQVDLVEPVPTQNTPTEENKSSNLNSESIKPAQGWIFNEKGEVVLTAYNPSITEPQRQKDNSANCPTP